jgi:hypothetical protein
MPFPETREAMEDAGYKRGCYSRCRGCKRPMEWWTTPTGKRIPMDPMDHPDSAAISHFATCPEAGRFKKEPHKAHE